MTVPVLVRGYPASGTLGAGARTITTAIDTTGLGANGAVIVGFSYQGKTGGSQVITGVSVSACTLDGVALTAIKAFVVNAGSTTAGGALYGILAPASNAAASLVITVTGDSAGTPGLTVNVGVYQDGASFGNSATYNDGSGTTGNQAISVTADTNALAVAFGFHGDTISGVGASTTIVGVANNLDNTSAGGCGIAGTRTGVGGSTTLTFNSAVTDHWTIHAVELVGTSGAAETGFDRRRIESPGRIAPSTMRESYGSAVGPQTFSQLLNVTETQTPSLVRSVGKPITVTQVQTPTLTRSVGKLLSVTQVQTATLVVSRAFLKALTVTQTQTASLVRSVGKLLNVTQTQTPTVTRSIGKTISVTETQAPTVTRGVGKLVSVTQVQTVTLVASRAFLRTLSVVQSQVASLARSVGKIITGTQTQTPTVALVPTVVNVKTIFRPPVVRDRSYGPERLWRHIATAGRGVNVYQLANGSYVEIEPPPGTVILRTYLGGHDNPITPAEAASLTAAGYGPNLL